MKNAFSKSQFLSHNMTFAPLISSFLALSTVFLFLNMSEKSPEVQLYDVEFSQTNVEPMSIDEITIRENSILMGNNETENKSPTLEKNIKFSSEELPTETANEAVNTPSIINETEAKEEKEEKSDSDLLENDFINVFSKIDFVFPQQPDIQRVAEELNMDLSLVINQQKNITLKQVVFSFWNLNHELIKKKKKKKKSGKQLKRVFHFF